MAEAPKGTQKSSDTRSLVEESTKASGVPLQVKDQKTIQALARLVRISSES